MQAAGMPAPAVPENKRGKRGGEMGAPPSFLDKLCDILDDVNLSPHIAWNKVLFQYMRRIGSNNIRGIVFAKVASVDTRLFAKRCTRALV